MIFQIQGCKLNFKGFPESFRVMLRISFASRSCRGVLTYASDESGCHFISWRLASTIDAFWVLWVFSTLCVLKGCYQSIRWICASFLAFSCIDMEIIEVVFESPVGSATTTWRGWPVITSLQQVFLMPMSWKIAASMKQSKLEEVWTFDAVDI